MCGVFGYVNYGGLLNTKQINRLYLSLSKACVVRGSHASGISYVHNGKLSIKRATSSIVDADFTYPSAIITLMAHCRLAIEDNYRDNKNNHPFGGITLNNTLYALAHNGILTDLNTLRHKYRLPCTDIETDSYGAVQLLNTKNNIDFESLKFVCESLSGSYTLTILDEDNNLFMCRGDVPVFLIHFKKLKLYIYISTRDLFEKAVKSTELYDIYRSNNIEAMNSDVNLIHIDKGEIVKVSKNGQLARGKFNFHEEKAIKHNWYLHRIHITPEFQRQIDNLGNN